jgi:hypothetical protein
MGKRMVLGALAASAVVFGSSMAAHGAPVRSQTYGEIERIILNDPNDHWSGGIVVVDGGSIIIPKNLLVDLPANRLTLKQIFDQAPAACVAAGESGLAKGDTCNTSGTGGFAAISSNVTNAGNIIAGDVFIAKGIELVTGTVTFINYTDGYLRVNGSALNATQVDDNTGVMVRINDPTSRHTVQQGLGCLPGSLNCSPDPRFTLDPDNYTNVFSSGFPLCIPSTVARSFADVLVPPLGTTTAQALPDGTGDVLCPSTNRTVAGGQPVDDSRRFAPIMLGDSITAEGNYETIGCERFLSTHTLSVARALTTKIADATQPDYMFLDEVGLDAAGFQNQRARTLLIGYTTEADTDVMVWSLHRDPDTNQAHEFPLATVRGCDTAAGPGTCGGVGLVGVSNIFKVRHDVDFLIGADPKLDPCSHLNNDSRMGTPGSFCPGGSTISNMFGVLGTLPHEIQARTGKKVANPGLLTLDVNGNEATNGQYLFPLGINLGGVVGPEFVEINLDALNTPFSFSGIPWNLDRRLSPGGCNGPCEATPQPLDPFPFEGIAMDPRTQVVGMPTGAFNDPHFTSSPLNAVPFGVSNRILSYVSGTNFDGNNTVLSWPPVDPGFTTVDVFPPVSPQLPVVRITSFPGFTAYLGQLYSSQVVATNPSLACGALIYSLDAGPAGMTISATGLIEWTPALAQTGANAVTVRVTDPNGFFDTQSFDLTVANRGPAKIGVFGSGAQWYLDNSGNGAWDGTPADSFFEFGTGLAGAVQVAGDWSGSATSKIGIYSDGVWYLDNNGNGAWDGTPTDSIYAFGGGLVGAVPVTGDWNGSGTTKIGIYADGTWYLDTNGNGAWDGAPTDGIYSFGAGLTAAVPVTGDWSGSGATKIGIFTDGVWYLDNNGNGVWDGTPSDSIYFFGVGLPGVVPVTGDWDGSGITKIGAFANGTWSLDYNGTGVWDGALLDLVRSFGDGVAGVAPVVGQW